MKNGTQKNKPGFFREYYEAFIARKQQYVAQSERVTFLLVLGFVSALVMQSEVDPEFFVGSLLISLAMFFIFFKDIKRYRPVFVNERKMVLLLGILLIATLFVGKAFNYINASLSRGFGFPDSMASMFGVPLPVGAMLVALIFDFHAALMFSLVISLLTGISFNNPFFSVYTFIGSLTAAFSVMRCKKRSALIRGGLHVSLANMAVAVIILLLTSNLFSNTAPLSLIYAAMAGFFVIAIVSISLPVIEYFFGISTDISLLELLDIDQPLIKHTMITAPGTYHHSVVVGNLAEAAAEGVGANALLAKVSSYYHDIGKTKMPEYFIENQRSGDSKHDKLEPHMSSIILISHVKEGVEMARQHKLPQNVIDIIQQHHGTRLMTFFYQKARDHAGGEPVNEDDYRYPGPKPRTKVAAIVMMADAVEASARALKDPTPARISALVEKIINDIFIDGQISDCDLTLKDMSEIKKRFTYVLTSIFHKRIQYPEIDIKSNAYKTKTAQDRTVHNNGSDDKEHAKISKDKFVSD